MRVLTVDNVVHYAEIVSDKHAARKLMLATSEIAAKGYEDYGDVRQYLDEAEAKIFEVTQRKEKSGPERMKDLVKKVFSSLDERFNSPDGITGVPTGIQLDKVQVGNQPGVIAHMKGAGDTRTLFVKQPNGVYLEIQVWDGLRWQDRVVQHAYPQPPADTPQVFSWPHADRTNQIRVYATGLREVGADGYLLQLAEIEVR